MDSNEIGQLVLNSVEKQEDLKATIEKTEKYLKEEEEADKEIRNAKRVLYSIVPCLCTAIASVGLSKAGYLNPDYVGVITLGTSAAIGSIVESVKTRKIVSSRTLELSGTRILRDRVYNALKLEKEKQSLLVEQAKVKELGKISKGEVSADYSSLENSKKECERALNDLAIEKGLNKQIPGHNCKSSSISEGLYKTLIYSIAMCDGYALPMLFAGSDYKLALFPAALFALGSLGYHVYKDGEKYKLDRKYRRLIHHEFEFKDSLHLEALSSLYAEELGTIEAQMATRSDVGDEKETEEFEEVDEDVPLFIEVWQEASKDKTLTKK